MSKHPLVSDFTLTNQLTYNWKLENNNNEKVFQKYSMCDGKALTLALVFAEDT